MREVKPRLFAGEDRAFQAVFVYDSHMPAIDPQWSISWMEVYNGAGVRDLSLEIQERPEGLVGLFQYRSETVQTGNDRQDRCGICIAARHYRDKSRKRLSELAG